MATMSITAGGGEVKNLTATPGSFAECDSCGATNDLIEWERSDRVGAKVYYSCPTCWYHIRDSVDEIALACDDCGATSEVKTCEGANGDPYRVCKVCWVEMYRRDGHTEADALELFYREDEHEYRGPCDECGDEEIAHDLELKGHIFHLCDTCFETASVYDCLKAPAKRQALECDDCGKKPATNRFNHLDGRSFKLCGYCVQLADHEEDYGADFGSVPRLRINGEAKLCNCPVPCDFLSPTRCELCKGIVVILKV